MREISLMKKDKRYCHIDHANKQLDRLRGNPNRASKRQATQREAVASNIPSCAADFADKPAAQKG